MKRYLWIPALIFAYLLCSSRSCGDGPPTSSREQKMVSNTRDSIREVSGSEIPSDDFLRASAITAKQKLQDFSDYCTLLNDTVLTEVFRERAAILIRSLFISDQVTLKIPGWHETKSLQALLVPGPSKHYPVSSFRLGVIRQIIPAERINDSLYSGKLKFITPDAEDLSPGHAESTAVFYLSRNHKSFGKETLQTWSVFLGEISE